MDKRISSSGKTLLKNVIRHTDTHNRMVEVTDMWQQHERDKQNSLESKYSFLKDTRLDMRYEFATSSRRRAHMDEEPGKMGTIWADPGSYWMKKLYKAEEADNDRWGHTGFKEMYPEKFASSDSSSTSSEDRSKRRRRKKKKKKHKRQKEHRKRKHRDSETDDSRERKSRKRHKSNKRPAQSDNESGCDSVYGRYGDSDTDIEQKPHLNKHNRQRHSHRGIECGEYPEPQCTVQSHVLHTNDESQSWSEDSSKYRQQANGEHFIESEGEVKVKMKKRKHEKRDKHKKKKRKHKSRHKSDSDSVSD